MAQSCGLIFTCLLVLQAAAAASSIKQAPDPMLKALLEGSPKPDQKCIVNHCLKFYFQCFFNTDCLKALWCNVQCLNKPNDQACNLLRELSSGYKSTAYRGAMQCMVDNKCIPPTNETDGKCLATDTQTIQNLTDMHQVAGRWWILKGLNCGQPGWPAGFDYFPCQYDDFIPGENGQDGIDHIGYCGGSNNTCATPMLKTVANWTIKKPGVLTHIYLDP